MDSDVVIGEILRLAKLCVTRNYGDGMPHQLANNIIILDNWLRRKGSLPKRWLCNTPLAKVGDSDDDE